MRPALRMLAAVKPVSSSSSSAAAAATTTTTTTTSAPRYIQPGLPTGLTGLRASTSPRSTLLYLYSSTLQKLKAAPESSLYRQSVENLTRSRLAAVESVVPAGHGEWADKMAALMRNMRFEQDQMEVEGEQQQQQQKEGARSGHDSDMVVMDAVEDAKEIEDMKKRLESEGKPKDQRPRVFLDRDGIFTIDGARTGMFEQNGRFFVVRKTHIPRLPDDVEWDGEPDEGGELEGSRSEKERMDQVLNLERRDREFGDLKGWEPEPQLTADQIAEIEDKIGSGLIEELIEVAEGELKLTAVMVQSKAWENLEEKPVEGQWTYFGRQA